MSQSAQSQNPFTRMPISSQYSGPPGTTADFGGQPIGGGNPGNAPNPSMYQSPTPNFSSPGMGMGMNSGKSQGGTGVGGSGIPSSQSAFAGPGMPGAPSNPFMGGQSAFAHPMPMSPSSNYAQTGISSVPNPGGMNGPSPLDIWQGNPLAQAYIPQRGYGPNSQNVDAQGNPIDWSAYGVGGPNWTMR